jgi:hypothetical protein
MGHGGLFSKIAFKLLPKESNAPIPANRQTGAHIEDRCHDKGSLQGLSKAEIPGLTNVP